MLKRASRPSLLAVMRLQGPPQLSIRGDVSGVLWLGECMDGGLLAGSESGWAFTRVEGVWSGLLVVYWS